MVVSKEEAEIFVSMKRAHTESVKDKTIIKAKHCLDSYTTVSVWCFKKETRTEASIQNQCLRKRLWD